MRFLPKVVSVYFKKEKRFDCKNNHRYSKSTNLQLNNIIKISYKILVIISHILLRLRLKKI